MGKRFSAVVISFSLVASLFTAPVSASQVLPGKSVTSISESTQTQSPGKVNQKVITKDPIKKPGAVAIKDYWTLADKLGIHININFKFGTSDEDMAAAYESAYKKAIAGAITSFLNNKKNSDADIIAFGRKLGLEISINISPSSKMTPEARLKLLANAFRKALKDMAKSLLKPVTVKPLKPVTGTDYRSNLDPKTIAAVNSLIAQFTDKAGVTDYAALAKFLVSKNDPQFAIAVLKVLAEPVRTYVMGPEGVSEKMLPRKQNALALIKQLIAVDPRNGAITKQKSVPFINAISLALKAEATSGKGNAMTKFLVNLVNEVRMPHPMM